MNRKTILFIDAGTSGKGGSFVSLFQILKVLSTANYRLVVVLWNTSPFLEKYKSLGAEVVIIKNLIYTEKKNYKFLYNKSISILSRLAPFLIPPWELMFQWNGYKKISKIIRDYNVNLVHLNNQPVRNFIGFWLAKKFELPVISHLRTLHGYGLTQAHINFLKQLNLKMIAVSQAAADYWTNLGIPKSWIDIIYNPYDGKFIKQFLDKKHCRKKLVYIGRIEKSKGVDYLLEAFQVAQKSISDLSLTVIGDGSYYQEMKNKAYALGMSNHVSFMGYLYDAKRLLNQYDVLVMPSSIEGFGRVLIEAMAAGVAVISTQISAINEIIENRLNGLLIPYGNVPSLTQAMIEIVRNHDLRETMQKNAYQTVQNKFHEDTFYKKLLIHYDELLTQH